MTARTAALVVGALDCAAFAVAAIAMFGSGSDAATKGLDIATGLALIGLLAVTAVPALTLVYRRRAPRTALALALAFPAAFIILFVAVVISLP